MNSNHRIHSAGLKLYIGVPREILLRQIAQVFQLFQNLGIICGHCIVSRKMMSRITFGV
jgi:hypothetical protein